MKIERISYNQIRCTLTSSDLLKRHLTLRKLTSGSPEAHQLFHELMDRSAEEVGFEMGGPLMVEASVVDGELTITVTRMDGRGEEGERNAENVVDNEADLPEAVRRLLRLVERRSEEKKEESGKEPRPEADPVAAFAFGNKAHLLRVASLPEPPSAIRSSLYYSDRNAMYYLVISSAPSAKKKLSVYALMLSEYGRVVKADAGILPYMKEHYRTVIKARALQKLRSSGEEALAVPSENPLTP
ncbi:MAG: adaptor protein MecA [Lachnospiraceae bacterium]|nr:adaptor protein MecA [Lachnospiraceae bacterium]